MNLKIVAALNNAAWRSKGSYLVSLATTLRQVLADEGLGPDAASLPSILVANHDGQILRARAVCKLLHRELRLTPELACQPNGAPPDYDRLYERVITDPTPSGAVVLLTCSTVAGQFVPFVSDIEALAEYTTTRTIHAVGWITLLWKHERLLRLVPIVQDLPGHARDPIRAVLQFH